VSDTNTLLVFRRASDARRWQAGGNTDFKALPMAWAHPARPVPDSLLRSRHPDFALDQTYLLRGIDHLLNPAQPVGVINLSLGPAGGGFDPQAPLQIATRQAHRLGVPVVVAAGNEGPAPGSLQPLAWAPWVLAVGATDGRGTQLLPSSSRGRPGGRGPTVVAIGQSEVVLEGLPDFEPGTSFAAPKVARLALWLRQVLSLLLGNLQAAASTAPGQDWFALSAPVPFAVLGIADTGIDPRALRPLPAAVQAAVASGATGLQLSRSSAELSWLQRWLAECQRNGLRWPSAGPGTALASPALVKRALQMAALPMPGYRRHEVGAGFVAQPQVSRWLTDLRPSQLALLLCRHCSAAQRAHLAQTLDSALGPLWDERTVAVLRMYFLDGQRLSVVKVM
jgi:hypothetical protein